MAFTVKPLVRHALPRHAHVQDISIQTRAELFLCANKPIEQRNQGDRCRCSIVNERACRVERNFVAQAAVHSLVLPHAAVQHKAIVAAIRAVRLCQIFTDFEIFYTHETEQYDTIRDAILTCARKPT